MPRYSSVRTKKRRFHGNRFTKCLDRSDKSDGSVNVQDDVQPVQDEANPINKPSSASERKLNDSIGCLEEELACSYQENTQFETLDGYGMVDLAVLSNIFTQFCRCPERISQSSHLGQMPQGDILWCLSS